MITRHDLEEAIAECQGQRNPNASTCLKLAAFYTIRKELFGEEKEVEQPMYSYAPEPIETLERCVSRGESRMRNFQRALLSDGLRLEAWPFGQVFDIDHAADIAKAAQFLKA